MNAQFFYIGANASGFLELPHESTGHHSLALIEPIANDQCVDSSIRQQYLQRHIGNTQPERIDLLVDNVSETIQWRETGWRTQRNASLPGDGRGRNQYKSDTLGLKDFLSRTDQSDKSNKISTFDLDDDSEDLQVINCYSAVHARKSLCNCIVNGKDSIDKFISGKKMHQSVERHINYSDQQLTLCWYRNLVDICRQTPSLYSISLLLESAFSLSFGVTQSASDNAVIKRPHSLVALPGPVNTGGPVTERHLYFRGGYLCFSRLVRIVDSSDSDNDSDSDSDEQTKHAPSIEKQRQSTLKYVARHLPAAPGCQCQSDKPLRVSDIEVLDILNGNTASRANSGRCTKAQRAREKAFRESLIDRLRTIANRREYIVARQSAAFCKAIRLDNTSVRYMRRLNTIASGKTVAAHVAFVLLTSVLCMQTFKMADQYVKETTIDKQIALQSDVLRNAQSAWQNRVSSLTAADAADVSEGKQNPPVYRYRGFSTDTMAWMVNARAQMLDQSLIQPLALLVRAQSIAGSVPSIILERIAWEPTVLDKQHVEDRKAIALNVTLNGRIESDAPINDQLARFETYLQVLKDAYSHSDVDAFAEPLIARVDYPFDINPERSVSAKPVTRGLQSASDASVFRVDMLVSVNTLADQAQDIRNLLLENTATDSRLLFSGLH